MASLPRAILFDLDDTLIRAYAQPEEAWTRLLHFFAAHLDAHATVDALRQRGVKLALVTNGAAEFQRAEIERFDLSHRFDHIQIEGEFGQGKPELAVYRHALERLGCEACDAWMVGDNYEWEVEAPQKLGLCGIWYDPFEAGIPAHATAKPTRVIRRLGELLE
jgi:putative hydrolase of the HAD superfamily